jgi:hypothetical protein
MVCIVGGNYFKQTRYNLFVIEGGGMYFRLDFEDTEFLRANVIYVLKLVR